MPFKVLINGSKLLLRHRASNTEIDATNVGKGGEVEGDKVVQTSGKFDISGWRKLNIPDDFGTVIFVYDIKFPKG